MNPLRRRVGQGPLRVLFVVPDLRFGGAERHAATLAPDPLDDPPVAYSRFQGLRAAGQGRSNDGPPWANSCVASLPMSTAPARARPSTHAAFSVGTV